MTTLDPAAASLTIRPFREDDEPGILRLWDCCFPDNPPRSAPRVMLAQKRSVQPELLLVGLIGDQGVGNVVATAMGGYDGHRGWVYAVATDPAYRRRGYGRAMLAAVELALVRLGCPKLNLQVRSENHEVVAFYRSLGFAVEERISMGKALAQGDRIDA